MNGHSKHWISESKRQGLLRGPCASAEAMCGPGPPSPPLSLPCLSEPVAGVLGLLAHLQGSTQTLVLFEKRGFWSFRFWKFKSNGTGSSSALLKASWRTACWWGRGGSCQGGGACGTVRSQNMTGSFTNCVNSSPRCAPDNFTTSSH